MTWIATVPPEKAEGELHDVYRTIGAARGGVADIHQAQSLNPRALRDAGFDDRAVLDAVLVVAYFSFVNRIALLLGVQVERGFEATCGPLPHA